MTPDLKSLAYTALLTAALWIPYIVCQVMTNGGLKPQNYRDPTPRPVPRFTWASYGWVGAASCVKWPCCFII